MNHLILLAALAAAPSHDILPGGQTLSAACRTAVDLMQQGQAPHADMRTLIGKAREAASACAAEGGPDGLIIRAQADAALDENDAALADLGAALKLSPFSTLAHYDRGLVYLSQSDYDAAVADFSAVAEVDPTDVDAIYERGLAYWSLRKTDLAAHDFDTVIAKYPQFEDAWRLRGLCHAEQGDWSAAAADDTSALALNPADTDLYFNRGLAEEHLAQHKAAIADFGVVVSRNPDDGDALFERALAEAHGGQQAAAIADYSRAIDIKPSSSLFNDRGVAEEKFGKPDDALADYGRALVLAPGDLVATENRVRVLEAQKRYPEAIAALTGAVDAGHVDHTILFHRGYDYLMLDDCARAEPDFSAAITVSPSGPAYFDRGICRMRHARFAEAIDDYNRVLALKPDDDRAFAARAEVHATLGEYDLALADYTQAIALKPDDGRRWDLRGAVEEVAGDRAAAIADYNRVVAVETSAIAAKPDDAEAYRRRAFAQMHLRAWGLAIADASKALASDPEESSTYYIRAVAYCHRKQYDAALKDLTAALAVSPQDENLDVEVGIVLTDKGDYGGALAAYARALALNSDSTEALIDRCWSRGMLNRDLPQGEQDCRRVLAVEPKSPVATEILAVVLMRQNRVPEALELIQTALAAYPKQPALRFLRGILRDLSGQDGQDDIVAATAADPDIADDYARFGIVPKPALK